MRVGPINFQPGEAAKVLLVVFFAAYLVDKRELLATGTRHLGRLRLPDPKHLGPLLLAWGVSILVMVLEKDLGSSLLFFAVFAAMLYIATDRAVVPGRWRWACSSPAPTVAYQLFAARPGPGQHVDRPVAGVADAPATSWSSRCSRSASGGFAGTGLGRGSPQKIPNATTDFMFSAIGEELGLLGHGGGDACVPAARRERVPNRDPGERPFSKLFAAGLTTIIGVQTFVIIGGVTRVIPLTGVTLPFVSYGGSSLIANFVIVALLLRISDETVERAETAARSADRAHRGGG